MRGEMVNFVVSNWTPLHAASIALVAGINTIK